MRRILSLVLATAMAGAAMAQSFTIVRPAEGSTVRENVKIMIPEGAIPDRAYIGVSVNGKFLEAAKPPVVGKNFVYTLDTKARNLPDGDTDIEVVLYMDFNDRAEIVNRSSVRVNLDNYTSIKIPDEGVTLRYLFQKGKEYSYAINTYQSVGTMTQAQIAIGSRAGEVPVDSSSSRLLYAIDNTYRNDAGEPEALLRMQGLPDKGKNYSMLRTAGSSERRKYYDFEMHPLYMRITDTGREMWGAVPPYFPLEGTSGQSSQFDLYSILPLPVLPSKSLFPGDAWTALQLFSNVDIDKLPETDRITEALASRGTFMGVEWEKGIPCAKFTIAVDAGPRELTNAVNLNDQPGEAQRVSLNGTMWFALDRGVIVRSDITLLQESVVTVGTPQGGGGTGGTGAGTSAGTGPGLAGSGGNSVGGGASTAQFFRPGAFVFDPYVDQFGKVWFFRQTGPRFGASGEGGGTAGGGDGRTGGGSGGVQKLVLRIRLRLTTELEL